MKTLERSWLATLTFLAISAASAADSSLSLAPAASIEISSSAGAFDFLRVDSKRNRLLADAIIYEPKNKLVYVTHDDGAEVWVIDAKLRKVVGTVSIPGAPEFMIYDERRTAVSRKRQRGKADPTR